MQTSLTQTIPVFDADLKEFLARKTPCALFCFDRVHFKEKQFDHWFAGIKSNRKLIDYLKMLHADHKILPAPVLLILATAKHHHALRPPEESVSEARRLSQARKRQKAIRDLDNALSVMSKYRGVDLFLATGCRELLDEHHAREYLETLKQAIAIVRARRPTEIHFRFAAQALSNFFRTITNSPMFETVGELLVLGLGWPRGAGDLRLAALQRAKGPQLIANRGALADALALQLRDAESRAHWLAKKKEFLSAMNFKEGKDSLRAMKRRERLIKAERRRRGNTTRTKKRTAARKKRDS